MKKFIAEFKEFALKGNMIDLAIGIIIGSAFNAVVSSIVNDVLMPVFGIILGGRDFSGLGIAFGDAVIYYGAFIQSLIDFLIKALCLFVVVKTVNGIKAAHFAKDEEKDEEPPKKSDEVVLLEKISDCLEKMTQTDN